MRWLYAVAAWAMVALSGTALAAKVPAAPVDLNHATIAELMQLPGVGEKRAQAIVRYREARPFRRPAELTRVKGFGRRSLQRLLPHLVVAPPPEVRR